VTFVIVRDEMMTGERAKGLGALVLRCFGLGEGLT